MTLYQHLATGCTTVCRAWAVVRTDGVVLGFTDHDLDLSFEGILFRAGSGLTAHALAQSTGLAVDNSEAVGSLSDASISETDLRAGRFDNADVRLWLVNWAHTAERVLQFRGTVGEVAQSGGQFRAELRGLTEVLNQPRRRVFQRDCTAVLGDRRCGVVLTDAQWSVVTRLVGMLDGASLVTPELPYLAGWFQHGRAVFLDGPAQGLSVPIKADRALPLARRIDLWREPGIAPQPNDAVRLEAGCDRQAGTCRGKFGNLLNFRGFPDIPGDDWVTAVPTRADLKDGGSRNGP